jgi:hypothetical protein
VYRDHPQVFERDLGAALEILLEFGAHGDLKVEYKLVPPQRCMLYLAAKPRRIGEFRFHCATTFEDEHVAERFARELTRAAGVGPAV